MENDRNLPEPPHDLPVVTSRHDGWTVARQDGFLRALAACGCVRQACAAVGMSHVSAYRLRALPHAIAFRAAWDAALDCAISRLEDAALSRAIYGVARPVFYKGEQVGEWVHHDERLAMFLLRYRRPLRFGSHLDRLPPPAPPRGPPGTENEPPDEDEAMGRLECRLEEIEDFNESGWGTLNSPFALDGGNFGNFAVDCDEGDAPLEPSG